MQQAQNKTVNVNVLFNRATIKGWELRQGIDQFAHHVCSQLGLPEVSVTWDYNTPTACINQVGHIKVRAVRDDANITNATLVRYAGFIVHELLHRKYSDFGICDAIPWTQSKYVARLHNAIEDAYIERTAIASGLLGNIKGLLTGLINGMVAEAKAANCDWADPAQYPFSLAVYAREYCKRVPVPAQIVPIWEKATRMIDNSTGSSDNLVIAQWVFDQLQNLSEDQPEDNPGEPCEDGEPGESGDESQNPGEDGEGESGEGQPGDGEGEGEGSEGDSGEGESGKGSAGDSGEGAAQDAPSDASEPSTGDDQTEGEGKGAAEDSDAPTAPEDAGKAQRPTATQKAREVEPTADADDGDAAARGGTFNSSADITQPGRHIGANSRWGIAVTVPAKMRYDIRRLFDDTAVTLFDPNRKAGVINPRALHNFGQTDRLFQLRRDIDGIDSAVVICIDVSDSMFDIGYSQPKPLIADAVKAAAALVETLHTAGVATAVVTFGDSVAVQIPFGSRLKQDSKNLGRARSGGGTNDFAAIKVAHDMLRARRETRKVCFVITDGMGHQAAAKQQCESGEKLGITTIGIGILYDVSSVYPHSVKVMNADNLAEVSFGELAKIFA